MRPRSEVWKCGVFFRSFFCAADQRLLDQMQVVIGLDLAAEVVGHDNVPDPLSGQADGYPIGSGTVESAIKQLKQRVAGPDMRWSCYSAEEILSLSTSIAQSGF